MSPWRILVAEIGYRRLNFLLAVSAVAAAAALFVAGPALVEAYSRQTAVEIANAESQTAETLKKLEDETRRLMRDMGFNLMIVHRDTDMSDLWSADFAAADMPQEYVDRLAADRRLTLVTHLVATLAGRVDWEGRKVLLVGYRPETPQAHGAEKRPMGYRIEPGTVLLGHELHGNRKTGDEVQVAGRRFKVGSLLPEQGSKDDITLAMNLADAQIVLGKPGRINQIMALGCNCAGGDLPNIRRQLAEILPETRITEFRSKALARAEQRAAVAARQEKIVAALASSRGEVQRTLELLAGAVGPLVVAASALWVGLLALVNVRERRTEIGLLRALGKSTATIAFLFLAKAVLTGLVGAAVGGVLGALGARLVGASALALAGAQVGWRYDLIAAALFGAPLVAAVASYLPTLSAVMADPASALRQA